jgi:small subunit ribosomal protein S16
LSIKIGENMLIIRLFRVGKKNQPSFKIVVTDKRKPPRAGRFVEEVGFYNPLTKEKVLKGERIKYWLSVGAEPSSTVHNLLIKEKIIESKKTPVHKKSKKTTTLPKLAPAEGGPLEGAVPEKPAKEKPVEEKPKEEVPKEKKKEETPKEEKKEELPKAK